MELVTFEHCRSNRGCRAAYPFHVTHNPFGRHRRLTGKDTGHGIFPVFRTVFPAFPKDDAVGKIHQSAALGIHGNVVPRFLKDPFPHTRIRFKFLKEQFGIASPDDIAVGFGKRAVDRAEFQDAGTKCGEDIEQIGIIEVECLVIGNSDGYIRIVPG